MDLTKLNESVQRKKHDLFSVDQTLGRLAGAKLFMKQDVNSGFEQIPFSPSSDELTTFFTLFGRYCVRRLTIGITSAPEYFQKRKNKMIDGLPGVLLIMDDMINFGDFHDEHDARVNAVLKRLEENGMTLNFEKSHFVKYSSSYLGHVISAQGNLY